MLKTLMVIIEIRSGEIPGMLLNICPIKGTGAIRKIEAVAVTISMVTRNSQREPG
jgi:hypothetical protein